VRPYEYIHENARYAGKVLEKERTLMGIFIASFDESGKLADSSCVAFGGCLASVEDSLSMSHAWDAILREHGIEYVRMTEALNCRGEFDGWKGKRLQERNRLLKSLVTLGQSRVAMFVCAPMSCEEFKALPEGQRRRLKNPQYCGFESCVTVLTQNASRLGHKLQLHCDSSEEYSETCITLYHKLRMRDQLVRDTCISITFAEDKEYPMLQLADVYASCVRQNAVRKVSRPDPLVDELLAIFGKGGQCGGSVLYPAGTGLGSAIVE
jgi:hypothetical protein